MRSSRQYDIVETSSWMFSASSGAKSLLFDRSRWGAEADRHPVVGVDQTDRDCEIGELFPTEYAGSSFIFGIGHACFGDPRHGLRPGKGRAFGTIEQRIA